jgi:MoxR-like ATPase
MTSHATTSADSPPADASVDTMRRALAQVRTEVGKAVVGQDGAVTGLIIALLARGHVLLEGVPGVAKPSAWTPNGCSSHRT